MGRFAKKREKNSIFRFFWVTFFLMEPKTASNTLKGSQKVQSFASNDEKICFLYLKEALQANRVHTSLRVLGQYIDVSVNRTWAEKNQQTENALFNYIIPLIEN